MVYGIDESIVHVLQEMKAHGPFDGVLSFSQGSIFFRHFYRVLHDIDTEGYAEYLSDPACKFPQFIISVSGPYMSHMKVDYKGEPFTQESFRFPVESLHIYGDQDEYKKFMTEHELYTKEPVVVVHDEGHKFPRNLSEEEFAKVREFVKKQFMKKYPTESSATDSDEDFKLSMEKYSF